MTCSVFAYAEFKDTGDVFLTKTEAASLDNLAENYEIYFFFRGDCRYCHQIAPTLKQFSEKYHLTVVPITLDGGGLPGYPNPELDDGKADEWQVVGVPSIYAVNHDAKNVYAIAYGAEKMQTIANRLVKLSADKK